ncbi:MAG TPA: hypothetical protein VE262_08695 [Blastocatellia bacterium]|nr:hypothetical protein [Blastocatellia bacterium]
MKGSPGRLLLLFLISCLACTFFQPDLTRTRTTVSAASNRIDDASTLAKLPLDFIENRGQWDSSVKFIASKGPVSARFAQDAINLWLGKDRQASLSLTFEGASRGAVIEGESERGGYYNFFTGNDPARWRSRVAAYGSLLYRGLYGGVDMRVREESGRIEYDLILAPGASLDEVVVRADGASRLEVAGDGSLILETAAGPLRQTPPRTWEELPNGERRSVECRFRKIDERRYGFDAERHDRSLPLVIDPGLEWSTYLGGGDWDEVHDLAPAGDGSGDAIVVGATLSPDFSGRNNPVAGFVVRFSATGQLVYKTILSGSEREWIHGLAVNAQGEPVVVGESWSLDYPTTPGAYDTTHGVGPDGRPGSDAFVTRLSAGGDRLIFSTFIGTNEYDIAYTVALTPTGAVVLAGETGSPVWPTTAGAFDRTHNCCTAFGAGVFSITDAFVARLSANGSALEYSTYFGGNGDEVPLDIVVDAQGFVTFTGLTYASPDPGAPRLPTTPGALQPNPLSGSSSADAFLTRMRLDGNGPADLRYSTFLGGNETDEGLAIALDPLNPSDVIVGGVTFSTASPVRLPTTAGTLRPSSTSVDGYVMRFRFPAGGGGSLVWSTLFGGFEYEEVADLSVNGAGDIVIVGETRSFDLPTTQGAFDRSVAISSGVFFFDTYAARISSDGARLLYGTYLGGSFDERHPKLALVGPNSAVVSGWTLSGDFPIIPGAHDGILNNNGAGGVAGGPFGTPFDGFVAKLTLLPDGDGDDAVATPAILAPANNSSFPTNTAITLDWSDIADPSGIDGYHVQLNRRPDFVCCNDWQEVWIPRSELVTSIRFDGPYYWRVQAADRSGNLSAWSEVRTFNAGAGVSLLVVDPSSVQGGSSAQATVGLSSPAPSGGASVAIRSSNTAAATVPSSVTISQGNTLRTFTVTTRPVSAPTSVVITATYRNVSMEATLTVMPATPAPGAPALLNPASGAQLPLNQSVTFSWSPVSGATTYEIQIDDSSTFSAPLVASQAGLAQTQFTRTFTSARRYWWRVRGRNAGGTNGAWSSARAFDIVNNPAPPPPSAPALSTLTLNPTTLVGGANSQGSVALTAAAPAGGAVVTLSSSNTAAATVPASITVSAGASGAAFTVTTRSVSSSTPVTISATYGGVTRTATLTVNAQSPPPPPATDTVAIQRAEYGSGQLRVEATSTNSSAVLRCYVTSTGALIGTLRNEGGGRYRADLSWSTNPQSITVRSSLGGSATRTVTNK